MQRLYHFDSIAQAADKTRSTGCRYFVCYGPTFSCHRGEEAAWKTAHQNNGPSTRPTVWEATDDGAESVGSCGPVALVRRFPLS